MLMRKFRHMRRKLWPTEKERAHAAWKVANGDATVRVEYDLEPDNTAVDLGGYEGRWASEIFKRYGCNIHVFEPVSPFAASLEKRFASDDKVRVYDYALGASNREFDISISGDGSSAFRQSDQIEHVRERKFSEWFAGTGLDRIELLKINIEGGEYELLDHLLGTGLIKFIRDLQIQFHDFVPDAERRMHDLRASISQTHSQTYHFPFIWDGWALRSQLLVRKFPIAAQ